MAPKKGGAPSAADAAAAAAPKLKMPPAGSLMALANLSAAISLDEMLSGLEKAAPASFGGGFEVGEQSAAGSEYGGKPPSSRGVSVSRRSARAASVSSWRTRGSFTSFGSRVQVVQDKHIRYQADIEARTYGAHHPSGSASEAARRARASADAVRDAASRVAAYKQRSANNPYVQSVHHARFVDRSTDADCYTPRSTGSRDGYFARTPRSTGSARSASSRASSRASSPESRGESRAETAATGRSAASSRSCIQPRKTQLGSVFCSPKSERQPMRQRTNLDVRRIALGPYSTIDGQRERRRREEDKWSC